MHELTETLQTEKDLSPEELKEYCIRLDEHLQNWKVDRGGLFERISNERKKIGETVKKIAARLEKIKTTPVEYTKVWTILLDSGILLSMCIVDLPKNLCNIL